MGIANQSFVVFALWKNPRWLQKYFTCAWYTHTYFIALGLVTATTQYCFYSAGGIIIAAMLEVGQRSV
jgi:hypothetical protein